MNLLLFSERDGPLTKGLRRDHRVVTTLPRGRGIADIGYDPDSETYADIEKRFPAGFLPEAVLVFNIEYLNFIWGLHTCQAPVFALVSDSNLCFDVLRAASSFVDCFVCNEQEQLDSLLTLGVNAIHLPWFSLDSDQFYPRKEAPLWDVVFVGNLNPYIHRRRGKLLEKLLSSRRFEARVLSGVFGAKYAQALSQGRIIFNCGVRGEMNMRVFEALGLKRLLLVEDSNREVVRYFKDRQHVVSYSDSNLTEIVEYYLEHTAEREAIAQAGHEEALARHTAFHRATALADAIVGFLHSRPARQSTAPDVLHRRAARIFLQHGQHQAALRHANLAVELSDTAENRAQLCRVLGTIICLAKRPDRKLLEEFESVVKNAGASNKRKAFTALNRIELLSQMGTCDTREIRKFVDEIERDELEIGEEDGPLQFQYDPFRVAWEETLSRFATDKSTQSCQQKGLLIAHAFELMADAERLAGKLLPSFEAYSCSLKHHQSGYVRQKLGALESRLGKVDAARESLGPAISHEAFFFGARLDLTSIELNTGRREEARQLAEESVAVMTAPFRTNLDQFLDVLDRCSSPESIERLRINLPIFWQGLFYNSSGYARETSLIVNELLHRSISIVTAPLDRREPTAIIDTHIRARLEGAEGAEPRGELVHVYHSFAPDRMQKLNGAVRKICRTTYETDRVPQRWLPLLKDVDQIWVMSEFNRAVFIESGIRPEQLSVIPSPLDTFPRGKAEPIAILNSKTFNFLSIFEWGLGPAIRKGYDILLRAYLSEFNREDDVSLILRVYAIDGRPSGEFRDWVREFVRTELRLDPDRVPDVMVIDEMLTWAEVRGLYQASDAFVLPSRGEGFGRPYLEALTHGLPVLATRWGGHLDFLSDENAYLIDIEGLEEVRDGLVVPWGHRWAKPSVDHLRQLLRRVYDDPEEGRRKATRGISHVMARHNVRNVANLVTAELNRLFV